MDNPPTDLHDLACALADGVEVDWDRAAAAALTPVDRNRILRMRLLASVAAVHRESAEPFSDDGRPTSASPSSSAAETSPEWDAGSRWGGLEIVECLGRGTSGQVYRALDPRLDREVALKLLHAPEHRFRDAAPSEVVNEARLLARVRHPNVAAVFGASYADDRVGIWMELVEGRTLEEEARERGPMPAADVVAIGVDLCRALGAVHRAGLLHRDVKAQNVMRDRRDGRIVLMDFSAGRERLDPEAAGGALPGTLAGSPIYLAPEILDGAPATDRSDLYSLGVLLFRLSTARFPVEGDSLAAIRVAHTEGRRLHLSELRPDVPAPLVAAIERAIDPAPSSRFASAGEMEQALIDSCAQESPGLTRPRRRWAAVAVGFAITAALGTTAYVLLRVAPQPRVATIPFAARDWVLVAGFENRTGDETFDGVLEHALERELSTSGFVNVVSRARVEDALALMKKPPETALDRRLATEVALRDGGIRVLITGRIGRIAGAYGLTTDVVNPADGVVVASISSDVAGAAALLPEVRAQALRVRQALGEALPSIEQSRQTLAKVATPSLAALQLYSRAATLLNGEYWLELDPLKLTTSRAAAPGASRYDSAEALLREATNADPTFASAWLLLSQVVWNRTFPSTEYLPFAERALLHSSSGGPAERYFIQGFAERRRSYLDPDRQGHLEAAVRAFEGLLQVDPDHYWGLLELGAVYRELGRVEDAERLTVRALGARPHSFHFAVEAAKASLRRRERASLETAATRLLASSMAAEPQTVGTLAQDAAWIRLWAVHDAWLDADVVRALQAAQTAERRWSGDASRWWLLQLAEVYVGLGRFADARRIADRMEPQYRDWTLALVATFREDRREFQRLVAPDRRNLEVLHNRTGMLTMNGWLDVAEWVVAERRRRKTPIDWIDEHFDEGALAVARHRYPAGIALLEPLTGNGAWNANSYLLAYESMAKAKAAIGDRRSAIRLLESLEEPRAVAVSYHWRVYDWLRCRVLLAELYHAAGRHDDADRLAKEVRALLGVAEPDHPLFKRLAGLERLGARNAG